MQFYSYPLKVLHKIGPKNSLKPMTSFSWISTAEKWDPKLAPYFNYRFYTDIWTKYVYIFLFVPSRLPSRSRLETDRNAHAINTNIRVQYECEYHYLPSLSSLLFYTLAHSKPCEFQIRSVSLNCNWGPLLAKSVGNILICSSLYLYIRCIRQLW